MCFSSLAPFGVIPHRIDAMMYRLVHIFHALFLFLFELIFFIESSSSCVHCTKNVMKIKTNNNNKKEDPWPLAIEFISQLLFFVLSQ